MKKRTPAEVLRLAQDEGIEIVDVRFVDLPGLMQHFSVPTHQLTEDVFEEGFGFDGSSIQGFQFALVAGVGPQLVDAILRGRESGG